MNHHPETVLAFWTLASYSVIKGTQYLRTLYVINRIMKSNVTAQPVLCCVSVKWSSSHWCGGTTFFCKVSRRFQCQLCLSSNFIPLPTDALNSIKREKNVILKNKIKIFLGLSTFMIYIDLFPHSCFCFFTMGEVSKTFTTAAEKEYRHVTSTAKRLSFSSCTSSFGFGS